MAAALPFDDSRRLTGANRFFATTGAVLEVVGGPVDARLVAGWSVRAMRACAYLDWPARAAVARPHAGGASLAIAAPCDQLFVATEVNEWALCAALVELDPARAAGLPAALLAAALEEATDPTRVIPPVLDEAAALARFGTLAAREARPRLRALVAEAEARALPVLLDDERLDLGVGRAGRDWPLTSLPAPDTVPWSALGGVPTALVTGSNGKTTTVRLVSACARAHGWRTGWSCTDGVRIDDAALATGDYSGPAGARLVLRDRRIEAAVLETARGGILRRGLAVTRADVAVVTNVSADHFGEYGIDDLPGLADAKLSIAGVVGPRGRLVLNAEDPELLAGVGRLAARFGRCPPLGWFALDAGHPVLRAHRHRGEPTCGVRDGRLRLGDGASEHDLGAVDALPLSAGGSAGYNVANLAAAALAAHALGVPPATIATTFAAFGAAGTDNPGRLARFEHAGAHVLVDYAHNPAALRGVLAVAERLRGGGRLALLLGHAGNRRDADIAAVAQVVAGFRPDLVVVKENEAQLRGRRPGEVPRILEAALRAAGLPEDATPVRNSELEAVHAALAWARPGDVVVLLVHSAAARAAVLDLLAG